MSTMSIIDQLKKNEKPFGLMSEEMCNELARMSYKGHRQIYSRNAVWEDHVPDAVIRKGCVYRLRSDYEEKPEIVECEILGRGTGCLIYNIEQDDGEDAVEFMLDEVIRHPDFIGFKFEDGSWYAQPIKPVNLAGQLIYGDMSINEIISGRVIILHATHVLFRGSK